MNLEGVFRVVERFEPLVEKVSDEVAETRTVYIRWRL
jgi:hypothetical protein